MSIDWELKYRNIKKKYKELVNIRRDSAKLDCEDISRKIQEHQTVHQQSIQELQEQNKQLELIAQDVEKGLRGIEKRQKNIKKLEQEISQRDSTIAMLLKYPIFSIEYLSKFKYRVRIGKFSSWVFVLTFLNQKNGFEYRPEIYPQPCPEDCFQKTFTFPTHQLDKILNVISTFSNENNL